MWRYSGLRLAAVFVAVGMAVAPQALALDGTWTNPLSGNWSAGPNWSTNPGVPNAVGDTARLTTNIADDRSVTIDTGIPGNGVTLGALYLDGGDRNWTIQAAAGKGLTLDASAGAALVRTDGTGSHVVAAPVVLNNSVTVHVGSPRLTLSLPVSSGVAGTGLTKTGAGTLVLATANTHTGGTRVEEGAVRVVHPLALGSGGVTVPYEAALEIEGGITVADVPVTLGYNFNVGTLRSVGGNNTWTGNVIISQYADIDVSADTLTITGPFTFATEYRSVRKRGAGTLILGGGHTITDPFHVYDGVVRFGNDYALAGHIGVRGGTLDLGPYDTTCDLLLQDGTISSSGGVVTGRFDFRLESGTVAAPLAGAGINLIKDSYGTVTIAVPCTYTGYTRIDEGTLQLGASNVIPDGSSLGGSSGTTFDLNGHDETIRHLSSWGRVTLGVGRLPSRQTRRSRTMARSAARAASP